MWPREVFMQIVFCIKTSRGHMIGTLYQDVTEQRQADEKIVASEEKFRSLIENSLEPILILDFEGTVLLANKAAALLTETSDIVAVVGRNVMEFIAPESQEDVIKDFAQVARGHDAYPVSYTHLTL